MINGRGLGGGGLINAMIAIRSLASDWDRWNLTYWGYEEDIVPHFVALERYSGLNTTINPDATKPWRGTKGPITTLAVDSGSRDPVGQSFVQAAAAAGLPMASHGFNTREPSDRIGAGFYEYNIRYGTRDSVAQALLGRRPVPSNLIIKTGHTVTRVLITPTGSIQAEGVAY
jgi:choline dehydrogenase